jgi:hypothetical protein
LAGSIDASWAKMSPHKRHYGSPLACKSLATALNHKAGIMSADRELFFKMTLKSTN